MDYNSINNIKTKEDFIHFIEAMIKDFEDNQEDWSNLTIKEFLEGMESWIDDMDGYYENRKLPTPENINWKVFADILYASRMYE